MLATRTIYLLFQVVLGMFNMESLWLQFHPQLCFLLIINICPPFFHLSSIIFLTLPSHVSFSSFRDKSQCRLNRIFVEKFGILSSYLFESRLALFWKVWCDIRLVDANTWWETTDLIMPLILSKVSFLAISLGNLLELSKWPQVCTGYFNHILSQSDKKG